MAALSKSRRRDQKWGKFKSGDNMDNRTSDDLHEAWKESEKSIRVKNLKMFNYDNKNVKI